MRRAAPLLLAALLAGAPGAGSAEPQEDPGPTPRLSLDTLPLGVPTGGLPEEARARVDGVLARTLFAHRIAGIRHRSREAVFRFLLDHPDFAATVARALRLGRYRLEATDGGYRGDDARGATGLVRVLFEDEERRLYHVEGRYAPRGLLPAVDGQMLVLLEFRHEPDGQGGSVLEAALTGHVRIDTPVVGALAGVVAALSRPLVEQAAERKVRRFFGTVARLSRWAHDEPEGLWAALDGHPDVPRDATLAAFRAALGSGFAHSDLANSGLEAVPLTLRDP